jgi:hypothetical protein
MEDHSRELGGGAEGWTARTGQGFHILVSHHRRSALGPTGAPDPALTRVKATHTVSDKCPHALPLADS